MSDEATARPTGSDEPQPLVVNVQYIKDLSFENPNAPGSLVSLKGAPDIHVDIDVAARGVSWVACADSNSGTTPQRWLILSKKMDATFLCMPVTARHFRQRMNLE